MSLAYASCSVASCSVAFFLCVLLAGTVLPLVAFFADYVLRKKISASAKHRLWVLTAVALALFPGVVLFVGEHSPPPELPVLPTPEQQVVQNIVQIPPVMEAPVFVTETDSVVNKGIVVAKYVSTQEVAPVEIAPITVTKTAPPFDFAALPMVATNFWLLGVALFFCHFAVVHFRSFCVLFPLRFVNSDDVSDGYIISGRTKVPFTFGMIKPVIVFPVEAKDWSPEKIRSVLLHEQAHIVRCDLFWQNVVHLVRVVYWFHPLVWLLARRVRMEQELACDDMVLQSGRRGSDYAALLLELSKSLSPKQPIPKGGLAMIRQKTVVKRIDSVLDAGTNRTPINRRGTLVLACVIGMTTFGVALFTPKIPLPAREPTTVSSGIENETKIPEQSEELSRLLQQCKKENETWNESGSGKIEWTPAEQRQFLDGAIATATKILAFPVDEKQRKQSEHNRMSWIRMIAFVDFEAGKERYEKVIAELEKTPGNEDKIESYRSEILSLAARELLKSDDYKQKLARLKTNIMKEFKTDPGNAYKRANAMLRGVRSFGENTKMPFEEIIEFYETGMKEFIPEFRKIDDPKIQRTADRYEGELRHKNIVGQKLELEGVLIDGQKFDWASYRGKPVLVYFDSPDWDTDEFCSMDYFTEAFQRVHEKYQELQFVGYGMVFPGDEIRYTDEELLKAMDRAKLPGVMLSGNKSVAAGFKSMNVYYGCSFSPCVLLIDRDGTVLSTRIGHVHKNFADRSGEVELDRTLRTYFETAKKSGDTVAGSRDEVNQDYIDLLKKRVEIAQRKFEQTEARFMAGAPDGRATNLLKAKIEHTEMVIALYRQTGEREKLLAALEQKMKEAKELSRAAEASVQSGTMGHDDLNEAELALAEAEYEFKKAKKRVGDEKTQQRAGDEGVLAVVPGQNPAPLGSKVLLFQGKTFEQWGATLQTELAPEIRAEAFRALAVFGANGRGKEAAKMIIDAVKGVTFTSSDPFPGTNPIHIMKSEAVEAFASKEVRIPFADSLPILVEKLANGSKNEQSFAEAIIEKANWVFDEEQISFFYDTLMQWDMKTPPDRRVFLLLRVLHRSPKGEDLIKFLRETIQKNDANRFGLFFSGFQPLEIDEEKRIVVEFFVGGESRPPLGLYPWVATVNGLYSYLRYSYTSSDKGFLENPKLTAFGRSLLDLLRDEGLKSKNETIRTTSQQVVDALAKIAELVPDQPDQSDQSRNL